MIDVVCLGILVADVVARPVDSVPATGTLALVDSIVLRGGGCALNTSSALVRLGLRARVVGKVGTDAFGDFVVSLLRERGVDGTGVIRDPGVPTSASVALVDSAGERTFLHNPGANDSLLPGEVGEEAYAGRALHLAGALVLDGIDGPPAARILAEARRRGLHTSLDPVFDASGRWERVLPALPHCDLVTPGRAEAEGISGESDPRRAARRLRELGAGTVAVTLGGEGCEVAADDFEGRVAAVGVEAVDGTGAGDAFAAGFLYAFHEGWPLKDGLALAHAAAAASLRSINTTDAVPTWRECLELARQWGWNEAIA